MSSHGRILSPKMTLRLCAIMLMQDFISEHIFFLINMLLSCLIIIFYSLMEKCRSELKMRPSLEGVDLDLLNKNIELALIQHLARFEEVIWQSFQEYEPYHIVQYLFELV